MNEKERKELAISKVVLLVLAAIAVICVIWLAWAQPGHKHAISSFEACRKAGNAIQLSYPEVCVTKDGKRFTNPEQVSAQLQVKEWDVSLSISAVRQPYYKYSNDTDSIYISTPVLDAAAAKVKGCNSGMHGVTFERLPATTTSEADPQAVKAGNYYYRPKIIIETLCLPQGDTQAIQTVQREKVQILGALPTIHTQ